MLLPGTAAVLLIWQRNYLLAGVLTGLAILLKPSAAPIPLLAAAWLFLDREHWRVWLSFAVGSTALPLLAVLHGALTAGTYEFLYAVALFRLDAGSTSNTELRFIAGWYYTFPVWFPLVVVSVPGWLAMRSMRQGRFIAIWLLTALAGMAMGGNWFEHYMLQLVPPLVLIAAVSVVFVGGQLGLSHRAQAMFSAGSLVLAVATLVAPWWLGGSVDGSERLFRGNPSYAVNEVVSDYIHANTTDDETIYVAVSQPDIPYLSGRRSAVPYLYLQQVRELDGALEEVLETLQSGEPAYVVMMHDQLEGLPGADPIYAALQAEYVHDRWFGEVEVFRRRESDSVSQVPATGRAEVVSTPDPIRPTGPGGGFAAIDPKP